MGYSSAKLILEIIRYFPIAGEIYGLINYEGDMIEIDLGSGSQASHSRDLDEAALDFTQGIMKIMN